MYSLFLFSSLTNFYCIDRLLFLVTVLASGDLEAFLDVSILVSMYILKSIFKSMFLYQYIKCPNFPRGDFLV